MPMTLLMLGGSSFVGRAIVEDAVRRGFAVTTFNRGTNDWSHPAAEHVRGDRLDPSTFGPFAGRDWDVVADTWSGAPRATRDVARALAGRVGRYVYVSSCSVYAPPPPPGADEGTPTVEASPDAVDGTYPELKRGSELAVLEAFGDRVLLARPGLILGPHEDVGRLPWWLSRVARGGEVLAPEPADLPLQYVDARDFARFVLDAATGGHAGPVNVVSRRGHATMRSLLEACVRAAGAADAHLTWVAPEAIEAAGIEPWSELPIWLPPGHPYAALHDADVERAHSLGLRCRPVEETVADTWAWLSSLDGPAPLRSDLDPPGVDPERERLALAAGRAPLA
ncbi:MAG TPA: NAD-dependent epimerase/dehydratase family protein [Solirubrobacteraceae bacterium]|jgi:nucleoside-diphosphate-sugar epimerase|nr:NAD-dependent epimerase/dehydratase family protein [Solirubrobacteraceae bacterium]